MMYSGGWVVTPHDMPLMSTMNAGLKKNKVDERVFKVPKELINPTGGIGGAGRH